MTHEIIVPSHTHTFEGHLGSSGVSGSTTTSQDITFKLENDVVTAQKMFTTMDVGVSESYNETNELAVNGSMESITLGNYNPCMRYSKVTSCSTCAYGWTRQDTYYYTNTFIKKQAQIDQVVYLTTVIIQIKNTMHMNIG